MVYLLIAPRRLFNECSIKFANVACVLTSDLLFHLSDNATGKNPYKSYGCASFAHVRKSIQKPYFAGEKSPLLFHIFGGFSHEIFAVEKIT